MNIAEWAELLFNGAESLKLAFWKSFERRRGTVCIFASVFFD